MILFSLEIRHLLQSSRKKSTQEEKKGEASEYLNAKKYFIRRIFFSSQPTMLWGQASRVNGLDANERNKAM